MKIAGIIFLTACLLYVAGCADGGLSGYAVEVTDGDFEAQVLDSSGPVLVMFYLPTCPHCRNMQQPVEYLARDMAAELKVAKLDASRNARTPGAYGVVKVPTFKMFVQGNVVATTVGEMPQASLYEWTKNVLASAN